MKEQKEVLSQYLMQLSVVCERLASSALYSKSSNNDKIFRTLRNCSDQSLIAVKQIREMVFEVELRKVLRSAYDVDFSLQEAGFNDKEFSNLYYRLKSFSARLLSDSDRPIAA